MLEGINYDNGAKMVVVFTIMEINYCGRPMLRFGTVLFVFIFVVLSSLAALFVLFPTWREKRLRLPKVIHHILGGANQTK